ncbi:MAG: hypothetical protein IT366_07000 [Candidatus Hydrogenedentes bacterium]|nr:hypothetical protein [Candidatus Hydrogenedentota bacterium]
MREIKAFIIVAWRLLRYFVYRLGIGKCPELLDVYPELVVVFDRVMGWRRNLRVAGVEHCPKNGPAVFSGNHYAKEDPFAGYRAIHRICDGAYPVRYMMRDDFFAAGASIFKSRLLDVDELVRLLGALQISRDRVQLTQLKPFIALLREQAAFIMYPGRSRSRTGMFVEYRDGIDEPGGVTFLVAQAQRNRPEVNVAIVPFARTSNMATKSSVVVFGPPVYLPHDADRTVQRDLDFRLIELMGDLVEVNITQIAAGILYLHCLHQRGESIAIDALDSAVSDALSLLKRQIDPAAVGDRRPQLEATLDYFAKAHLILRRSDSITLLREKVLASPPPDTTYRSANPIKYAINQVLHLPDVIDAVEAAALTLAERHLQ